MTPQFDGFGGPLPLPAETRRWGHVRKSCRTERQDRTRPREPRGARLPAGDSELKSAPKSSRGEIAGRHTEAPPNRAQRCQSTFFENHLTGGECAD